MFQKLRVCISLVCLTALPGPYLVAKAQIPNATTLNLEKFGWQPLPKGNRYEQYGSVSSRKLSIDHKGRVLVGFTVRENYGLATREHPGLSFHILRLTSDGKVDLSFVVATKDYFTNGLYLGPNDQIYARANDSLQLLSEENETGKEGAAWQVPAPCSKSCHISQSPSRRTLIIQDGKIGDPYTFAMLDASSSPPVLRSCPEGGGAITDKFSYISPSYETDYFAYRWPLCDPKHRAEMPLGAAGNLFALNDQALLLLGTRKKDSWGFEVVSPDGQLKFRKELPKHSGIQSSWTPSTAFDERGDRFAFIVETWQGQSDFFDLSGHKVARRVVVYSEAGQELASISVSTTYHRDFDFSLSPDGHRLAILDNGDLIVANIE
jgi:hypothetical protein